MKGPISLAWWLLAIGATPLAMAADTEKTAADVALVEEIVVSGDARLADRLGEIGSWDALDAEEIDLIGATHPSDALLRIPGVWITRNSGQEHLTAIRSAVLTGAGSCGEFVFLENGIPVRPAGFCNVNGLFEMNTEQAGSLEVWRGPASAVLGGNALHGAINVVNRLPQQNRIGIEGGPYDYYRVDADFNVERGGQRFAGTMFGTSSNGYRDSTGVDQQKASLVHQTTVGGFEVESTLNFTNLNQDTGGYVEGFEAYKDDDLRKTNPSPESYRNAKSVRLASRWSKESWYVVPYLRYSRMDFLQHFLPGEPQERNDQTSGGVVLGWDVVSTDTVYLTAGANLEYMDGHLDQWQAEPLTDSSAFNNAVRPQGWQYDYDVTSVLVAGYYDFSWEFAEGTRLVNSLRLEYLGYDYDNLMLDGNTRDDGTTCGFGGCLYNRPADRKDDFTNLAGRLGVERDLGDGVGYLTAGSGFRVPQATELYRLQRFQDVADLNSEELVSVEIGYRGTFWNAAAYAEKLDNFIFRDARGFNIDDGKTKAWGIEAEAFQTFGAHTFSISGTYAEHKYDFDSDLAGGEVIAKGNYEDTAPKWMANGRWQWSPSDRIGTELELVYIGEHYIDAGNTAKYDGHLVANLRGRFTVTRSLAVHARIVNLADTQYADRGDFTYFSADGYRYFPAMPRQFYLGATISF